MNIRTLTLSDFSMLFSLWQKTGLELDSENNEQKRFAEMAKLSPDLLLGIYENGQLIASILGSLDGRTASIHHLIVHPDFQGQGLGKKLLLYLQETLRKKNIQKLVVQVQASNGIVCGFYEKQGFTRLDDTVIMSKDL